MAYFQWKWEAPLTSWSAVTLPYTRRVTDENPEYSNIYMESNMATIAGHSGEYGNDAKLVGKMSKSVMQLISIHF